MIDNANDLTATLPGTGVISRKRSWEILRTSVLDFLHCPETREALETFRLQMTQLFESMRDGRTEFERRPNISLRLIADGDTPSKVIVLPGFHKGHNSSTLLVQNHAIELLEQNTVKAKKDGVLVEGKQFQRRLTVKNHEDGPPDVGRIYPSALRDAHKVVGTIRDFLADRRAVLARNCDQCCICGRKLTDELSRSRGIGPECVQTAAWKYVLGDPQFAVAETL